MDTSRFRDPAFWAAMSQQLGQMAWAPVRPVENMGQPMADYQAGLQAKATENKTLEWLKANDPEAYQYAQAGMPVADVLKYAMQKRAEAQKPKTWDYKTLNDGTVLALDPTDPSAMKTLREGTPKNDLPTSVDEYNWLQSQPPEVQQRYMQWKQQNQSKNGLRVTYDEQGRPIIEQGNIGDLKEWQSKDRFWTERLVNAESKLQKYESTLTSLKDTAASNAGTLGNYMKSNEYQLAEQAMKDFLAPVLRKDTGAAVTAAELELYRPLYFPMPGDSPDVIAQKRMSRQVILQSLGSTTGVDTSAATNPANATPGGVVDYKDFFNTP